MTDYKINILSPETASKIAAGEVVEKPASVVKELVENSIDAGAKTITVEIVNGGLDLIRIIDDGRGIRNADMERAFLPHATSKIKQIDDIFDIMSLGFRGEALASVAAVSRILLKSHAKEDEDGMEIFYEGGEEKFKKYSALDQGTIIDVRDLFYNVPARLKFLKTPQREASDVTNILTRLALSRPDITFTYYNNDKLNFRTYGTGKLVDVIRTVYNRKTAEQVRWFERESDGIKVYGYIGNEQIARGSRNQQSLFINGRYITSRALTVAVEQAFKSFITISKFPFFVLFLEIPPNSVDVNVHPQKAEVKFSDDRLMFHTVFETIHGVLRTMYQGDLGFEAGLQSASNDVSPTETVTQESFYSRPEPETGFAHSPEPGSQRGASFNHSLNPNESNTPFQSVTGHSFLREDDGGHPKDSYPMSSSGEVSLPIDLKSNSNQGNGDVQPALFNSTALKNDGGMSPEKPGTANQAPIVPSDQQSPGAEAKFPMPRIIGQYQKTYILAQLEDALYLFDQHAAHEKINFERYMNELLHQELVLQPLLVPQVLDLAMDDYAIFLENEEVFKDAGFSIEEFGERALNVREVPYFLSNTNAEVYLKAIIDNLKNLGKGTSKEVRYLRIATAACKSSVRANDELSRAEMEHLIHELRFLKEPFTCPHGRPTMIRFTLTDVEKMFRRIQ